MTKLVKDRSAIMKDRLVHPQQEAVYWIEHILKHNGAPHIRSPVLDLAWYVCRIFTDRANQNLQSI